MMSVFCDSASVAKWLAPLLSDQGFLGSNLYGVHSIFCFNFYRIESLWAFVACIFNNKCTISYHKKPIALVGNRTRDRVEPGSNWSKSFLSRNLGVKGLLSARPTSSLFYRVARLSFSITIFEILSLFEFPCDNFFHPRITIKYCDNLSLFRIFFEIQFLS